MTRSDAATQNTTTLEQRWNLVKGQEYVVDQGASGFIGTYMGFSHFHRSDGRDSYPMPAQVRDITPRTS